MVLSCSHIYCHNCLKDLQSMAARRGHSAGQCAECGERWTSARSCQEGFEAMQARPTSASSSDAPRKTKKPLDKVDWLHLKGEILPSAKTMALKAQILEWIAEDTECKIIVSGNITESQNIVLIQAGIYPMAADDKNSREDLRNRTLGLLHIQRNYVT
jgi:hypothetical protein